jgi:large subunit ribosomal protein L4
MKKEKITLSVYDLNGKAVETIQLDEEVFDGTINKTLLYEVNKMYEANKRKSVAKTKTRSEVSGGGAKPWRQKGTGRARVGSSRNPLWRHGGTVFGPHVRDYSYSMPKKAIRKALISSLNARISEEMFKPVVKLEVPEVKTKEFQKIMNNLQLEGKTLVVVDSIGDDVRRSSRNIKKVTIRDANTVNARDVLLSDCVLIEKDALSKLSERLK